MGSDIDYHPHKEACSMHPDGSGQYRRDLGWKKSSSGKRTQHRFYLGHDEDAAALAERRLVKFWAAIERYFEQERDGEDCIWEGWSLALAKQIADGAMVVQAEAPEHIQAQVEQEPTIIAGWFNMLKEYFGTICGIEMAGVKQSQELLARRGQFNIDRGKRMLEAAGKPAPTGETFHQAIDAYIRYLHQVHQTPEKVVSQTGKKQGERAARMKRHHLDLPLYDLTAKKIEEILLHWGKRPFADLEKRYSRDTCKNQLILIRAFLRWLHRSDFQWKLPPDYLFPRMKIEWLPTEISGQVKKRTFTVKEVGILWKNATPLERVFIALGINCGFGGGEIGTLAEAEISEKVIKRLRHKTKVFGAWWLFPITRDAIAWARKRKEV